jgi:O-acetyl-ADP-ribose deacetylase (regulator of RNase III)
MTHSERISNLDYICRYLLDEHPQYRGTAIPESLEDKQRLMRSLLNIRPPEPVSDDFLKGQDFELQAQLAEKGVVELEGIGLKEWQGDITRLKVDTIVNAANSQMLGCFLPLHRCIDNAIHSAAGVQLRLACADMMQGGEEPTGSARITPGFNLPARYVLHTVGPIVPTGRPLPTQEVQLASCYRSCLNLASERGLESVAFCCISTGEFRFPNDLACRIAVSTVRSWLAAHPASTVKTIVFNTFKDIDHELYTNALAEG